MYIGGYKFLVLNNLFMNHWGLQKRETRPLWRRLQHLLNNRLFIGFAREITARYNRWEPWLDCCWASLVTGTRTTWWRRWRCRGSGEWRTIIWLSLVCRVRRISGKSISRANERETEILRYKHIKIIIPSRPRWLRYKWFHFTVFGFLASTKFVRSWKSE